MFMGHARFSLFWIWVQLKYMVKILAFYILEGYQLPIRNVECYTHLDSIICYSKACDLNYIL
jgi:hypothetical protein